MTTLIENMDDPYATDWPVVVNGVRVGEIVEDGSFYRARRTAGAAQVTHQGPARYFHQDAADDLSRWLDAPLSGLHIWTEVEEGDR